MAGKKHDLKRQANSSSKYLAERDIALRSFESGSFGDAAHMLVSLLAQSPLDPLLLRTCGMSLLRIGSVDQGLPYLARARRLAPRDPIAALWHGIGLAVAGRLELAVTTLQAAAVQSPGDPAPLVHLSRTLLKLDRPGEAATAGRAALSLAPAALEPQHAVALAEIALLNAGATEPDPNELAWRWYQLGLVCARLQNLDDARNALEKAISLAPDHADAAAELAMIEHLCGEPLTAITRLRQTLARIPNSFRARLHLASRLTIGGNPVAALEWLDQPPAEQEFKSRWHAHRVDAFLCSGRPAEARAELKRIRVPDGDAEILLSWHRARFAANDGASAVSRSLLKRVEELAWTREAATLEDRVDAHFNLANLHHVGGRPDPAFAHWHQGHALMRYAQPFTRIRQKELIDNIINVYDENRFRRGPRTNRHDPMPVFVVGLPRTGTSLVEHILNAHHAVHGAGERLAVSETLQNLTGTTDEVAAVALSASVAATVLEAAADTYLETLHTLASETGSEITRVVDKLPDNVFHLGFIATLLPGARVICCTRDLRDVGTSIFQRRFLGHHPYAHDLGDLGWYMSQHQRLLMHWQACLPVPVLLLDHSEWITDFDQTLRRVLNFLQLEYDPACAHFFNQSRVIATASQAQVTQPINARGVDRWRPYAAHLRPMFQELPALRS